MEKTMSSEERMKRAEEIYYRRRQNNNYIRMSGAQVRDGKEKRQVSLLKKMIIQILICVVIYLIFSLIKEANYIFSEQVLNQTKQFLNQDINFEVIGGNINQFLQDNKDKLNFLNSWIKEENEEETGLTQQENQQSQEQQNDNKDNEDNTQNNSNTENTSKEENNTGISNNTIGIGGASNNEITNTDTTNNDTSNSKVNAKDKTQMQLDAEYIKANFDIGIPVKGKITSRYGSREATEIVTADHQGIDIGVNVGTQIVSAMDGKVSSVSDEGEYGTHVKIVNKDITTIYAHCSKILVKQGQTVKKGQKIALSGNTGRTTGPHLHFEIRRDNRPVNPELVL